MPLHCDFNINNVFVLGQHRSLVGQCANLAYIDSNNIFHWPWKTEIRTRLQRSHILTKPQHHASFLLIDGIKHVIEKPHHEQHDDDNQIQKGRAATYIAGFVSKHAAKATLHFLDDFIQIRRTFAISTISPGIFTLVTSGWFVPAHSNYSHLIDIKK